MLAGVHKLLDLVKARQGELVELAADLIIYETFSRHQTIMQQLVQFIYKWLTMRNVNVATLYLGERRRGDE